MLSVNKEEPIWGFGMNRPGIEHQAPRSFGEHSTH